MPHLASPVLVKRAGGIVLATVLASQLSACFPLVVAGAGAGVVSVQDRRPTAVQWNDERIDHRVSNNIESRFGSLTHVNAYSYNHRVLLTGEVPDDATRASVEKIARETEDVKEVYNELAVMLPSSLSSRTSDSGLQAKIKGVLIDTKGTSPVNVKVTVERGAVYLMGQVSRSEGKIAADAISKVSGVEKVGTYFEYLD
ncbi:MAG: BON domain-containing protein [Burkholderiales bacterium]|nr:BON domain-containing protein [Burkholderiales bacterium]